MKNPLENAATNHAVAVGIEAQKRAEQGRQSALNAMHTPALTSTFIVIDPYFAAKLRQIAGARLDDADRKILGLPSLDEEIAALKKERLLIDAKNPQEAT